jgi:hypothetical protein
MASITFDNNYSPTSPSTQKKTIRIRPKVTPNNEVAPLKKRKTRTAQPNKLQQYGFDPSLSWNLPRFKKFLKARRLIRCENVELEGVIVGNILELQKGIITTKILFLGSKFNSELFANEYIRNFISCYSGHSSKGSRFVYAHSSSKSWGTKKVATANSLLKELIGEMEPSCFTLNIPSPLPSNFQIEVEETRVAHQQFDELTKLIKEQLLKNRDEHIRLINEHYDNLILAL